MQILQLDLMLMVDAAELETVLPVLAAAMCMWPLPLSQCHSAPISDPASLMAALLKVTLPCHNVTACTAPVMHQT